YSDNDYISFLKQITIFKSLRNKKIAFFLCSDEQIDYAMFNDFNIISSTNHPVEDLYALSYCNIIIGPPSTFSSWAAFYGSKPLIHLYDSKMKINEDDFIGTIPTWL
ncbi:MAG TPA: hypothetical protein VGW31_12060, partial [Hanamia sp.]|nr:hypothetical protein [Hanamia sp.]